jgi:transposase
MSKKRKQYSNDFKEKVALAAIRGDETVPQLATRYGLHPTQINSWSDWCLSKRRRFCTREWT